MELIKLNIYKVKNNPDNPRTFKVWDVENMVKSLLTFPEMLLKIRPIAIRNNIVLGGNLRLKALHKILDMNLDDISIILAKHSKDKSQERIEYLIELWSKFQDTKEMTFINADSLSPEQVDEFIIKDNVSLGSWDVDMLSSWDLKELKDWGLNDWDLGIKEDNEDSQDFSDKSKEIDVNDFENDKYFFKLEYSQTDYEILKDKLNNLGKTAEAVFYAALV